MSANKFGVAIYQNDDVVMLKAPAGGVVTGQATRIGNLFGFPVSTAAAGANFNLIRKGIFKVAAKPADANGIDVGDAIYFDEAGEDAVFTNEPAEGLYLVGVSATALAGAAVGSIEIAISPSNILMQVPEA